MSSFVQEEVCSARKVDAKKLIALTGIEINLIYILITRKLKFIGISYLGNKNIRCRIIDQPWKITNLITDFLSKYLDIARPMLIPVLQPDSNSFSPSNVTIK